MLPQYVNNLLAKHFTPEQVAQLNANWFTYSEILFSRSTDKQILSEARMILTLLAE